MSERTGPPDPTDEPAGRPLVRVVQHQGDCAPAWFGTWLEAAGCDVEVLQPWRGEKVPARVDADGLVVLGGSMGAHDDDTVPWLGPVKALLRSAADDGTPTLGICLGHQLVAVALGGRVARNPAGQTVGLTTIGWTEDAASDPLVAPLVAPGSASQRGVHWNDDVVVEEPAGTVALARTADGSLQVARFAATAWGVQLHPEADRRVVDPWAAGDAVRHAEQGRDQAGLLARIEDAGPELATAWEPLARSFAGLCRRRSADRPADRSALGAGRR
ncbi:type 1 glutamine amidotransferase [Nocardioides sp. CFH 31398]|uniref:type 1 glutamine amidotransferase n=1 Tax=Nocardioides sp. CFH 31398 TaxID=2919579 RepID=UPI001F065B5F|nr:type 1 glutamine amidotransferase [Nocardioides sp. CFH 31398]MCH1868500.1 type 1 glutamine amidotransferase [Nocardioides sp. CFH 31398]